MSSNWRRERDEFRDLLQSRDVLFSCEGTAESVITGRLVQEDRTLVPSSQIVEDRDGRPFTTLRNIKDLQREFFGVDCTHGLMIVRRILRASATTGGGRPPRGTST